jgi:uncharacterized NAD-dependent epimerase/dehydratase family protein
VTRDFPEGSAIVYCQGFFGTTNGKTAHGLVRRCERYRVLSVVDARLAGRDAGEVLDRKANGIPVFASLREAFNAARRAGTPATHMVIGLAPDGGRLSPEARRDVKSAIRLGLNVDCGLHDYLSEDPEVAALAKRHGVVLRDVRKPPPIKDLHFFSGKIEQVRSLRVAMLGADSAIGKRTTAWVLVDALRAAGITCELVGTGQTAWMQGAKYSILLDSLVNDFVAGEIEHAVWSAWEGERPDVILLEGQGSLLNPAYPGGFELLAAGRPDVIVFQWAETRKEYDGFPGFRMHPLEHQIHVLELISGKPVVAITLNHEGINPEDVPRVCARIERRVGLPTVDVLVQGADRLVRVLRPHIAKARRRSRLARGARKA